MTQRLPPSLTPLDTAIAALLRGLQPVAAVEVPLSEAAGRVAAGPLVLAAHPPRDVAAADGWALCAGHLVGASSYSPLPLATPPVWVDAGDAMPAGCDCVLDADAVEMSGALAQAVAESAPGQGVRRTGADIPPGTPALTEGEFVGAANLLLARAAGLQTVCVRRPRLRIVNVPAATATLHLIADLARAEGLEVQACQADGRDEASIADALDGFACDLLVTIGGSGVGRADAAVLALGRRGEVLAHGLALAPGLTSAVGRLGPIPVVALPGAPDAAMAAFLALVLPVLDRLSMRSKRRQASLPLARKIASRVGISEIVLLAEERGTWTPLAVGEWPLLSIARAEAWLRVPGDHEGFAAGEPVDAYLMPQ